MKPKVARPCRENELYTAQNPRTMLYEGNAKRPICVSMEQKPSAQPTRSSWEPYSI